MQMHACVCMHVCMHACGGQVMLVSVVRVVPGNGFELECGKEMRVIRAVRSGD